MLLLFMPPAVGTTKSKKTGKKPKAPALPNSKKTGISQPRKKPLEHTTQISKKKSDKASRKTSSSAVSGKVGEIVSPLVLNYWNGRGLMEVPRMMLGKQVSSCSQKIGSRILQLLPESSHSMVVTLMRGIRDPPQTTVLTPTSGDFP